jgi:hypothetical protein
LGVSVESVAGEKAADPVARGRYLVTIGGWNDCHHRALDELRMPRVERFCPVCPPRHGVDSREGGGG